MQKVETGLGDGESTDATDTIDWVEEGDDSGVEPWFCGVKVSEAAPTATIALSRRDLRMKVRGNRSAIVLGAFVTPGCCFNYSTGEEEEAHVLLASDGPVVGRVEGDDDGRRVCVRWLKCVDQGDISDLVKEKGIIVTMSTESRVGARRTTRGMFYEGGSESGRREEEQGWGMVQVGQWHAKEELQEVKMVEAGRTCDWWGQGEVTNGEEEPRVFWQLDEDLWSSREQWPDHGVRGVGGQGAVGEEVAPVEEVPRPKCAAHGKGVAVGLTIEDPKEAGLTPQGDNLKSDSDDDRPITEICSPKAGVKRNVKKDEVSSTIQDQPDGAAPRATAEGEAAPAENARKRAIIGRREPNHRISRSKRELLNG